MLRRLAKLSPFFLILLVLIIPFVYAEEEPNLDIMGLPQELANRLGMPDNVFAAGILLSTLVLVSIALTLALLKAGSLLILIVCFTSSGFLVAIGWLPVFLFFIALLLIAVLFGPKIVGKLT